MILGQLKIGERQATFGCVLTITCASAPPTTNADQNDQLKLFIFSGWVPSQPVPSLWFSVAHQYIYLHWDCFWNVIKPTAFHFVRKYAVWSSNQMVHQSSSCLERTKFPSFSFEMGPLHWPMRRKSTTPKFCRCFSLPLPSECREKKATSPFFKRQISNSPPVLFTTGTKKAKTWDKPENIKTLIYLKSTQPKRYR